MAVDEALLEAAAAGGSAVLRLYQWTPATLSLGYFQAAADRQSHAPSLDCPLVRRASGGGAILHDRELTYSVILRQAASQAHTATALYNSVHGSLVAALAEFGVGARMHCPTEGCSEPSTTPSGEPFLCFQRRSRGDILCGQHKIVGSAQRRRRGAVLQHGSILLACSPHAPELPGVAELTGEGPTAAALIAAWIPRFEAAFSARICDWTLSASAESRAHSLVDARFGAAAFTHQR